MKSGIIEGMLFLGSGPMNMTVERVSYLHENEINEFMNTIKHALRPGIETQCTRNQTCRGSCQKWRHRFL